MTQKPSPWFRMPVDLMKRDDLSSNAKLVYAYMLWKYRFFSSKKKDYFESQNTIAEALDISRWTVNQSIAQLQELGLLQSKRKKGDALGSACIYSVPDTFDAYASGQNSSEYDPNL